MKHGNNFKTPGMSVLSSFCMELSMLASAGIPFGEGFLMLSEDEKDPGLKALLLYMHDRIEDGDPVYKAMESTKVFPDYIVRMTETGERTGRLESAFSGLSNYYDNIIALRKSIINAVIYPIILIILMLTVIGVILTRVIPIFDSVFSQLGATISPVVSALMNTGLFLAKNFIPVIIIIVAIIVSAIFIIKKQLPKSALGQSVSLSKFLSAMYMATSSGLDIYEAIDLAQKLCMNQYMSNKIQAAKRLIEEGNSISAAFTESKVMPMIYGRLLSVGIKSGLIEKTFAEISSRCEEDVYDKINGIVLKLEPTLVITLSLVVGLILLAVMLPLMSIMSALMI